MYCRGLVPSTWIGFDGEELVICALIQMMKPGRGYSEEFRGGRLSVLFSACWF